MVENIKTYRVIFSGRVQGVGFRYFVESIAVKYGIKGYVRNTYDGKVEVVCQGEEEDLRHFIEEIKKGPSFSVVTNVEIEEIEDRDKYSIFEIRY
jgi:acylphosphatase